LYDCAYETYRKAGEIYNIAEDLLPIFKINIASDISIFSVEALECMARYLMKL
jgi:hypothetical protein